jgi:hypothetical protein
VASPRLSSPRTRRRLAWLGAVAVVCTAAAALVVLLPGGSEHAADESSPAATGTGSSPAAATEPRTVPVPRAQITRLLDAFIPAVVARHDLAAGWKLVTPQARGSKSDWLDGITPFQSYAARPDHYDGFTVNYSYPGDVGFDVFVRPKDPRDVSMAFRGEAKRIGGIWKIDVFYPQATFAPVGNDAAAKAARKAPLPAPRPITGRLSAAWLFVPFAVVGLIVLAAIGLVVGRALRRRGRIKRTERDLAQLRR